jgi:2-keto-4-pentenoate hydratase/2-oxohepta-3-ene-1,7-dioic acid hydratase in catechol pathway
VKIARIKYKEGVSSAVVEDDRVNLISGNIFDRWEVSGKSLPLAEVKLLAPVEPLQIVAIGLNYREHAREGNFSLPEEPVIFIKTINTITGPESHIILPKIAPDEVDYEAEMVIVIGKKAKNVPEEEADKYILGYTCGNDVSARDCQLKKDKQWARGKSFDTFAPIGPWIVTDIEGDNLGIKLILNDRIMQNSTTSDMIFPGKKLVSFISHCLTLYPGSIILTGTPAGVGFTRKPPVFLREGDTVVVEIEHIGRLVNYVKKEPPKKTVRFISCP